MFMTRSRSPWKFAELRNIVFAPPTKFARDVFAQSDCFSCFLLRLLGDCSDHVSFNSNVHNDEMKMFIFSHLDKKRMRKKYIAKQQKNIPWKFFPQKKSCWEKLEIFLLKRGKKKFEGERPLTNRGEFFPPSHCSERHFRLRRDPKYISSQNVQESSRHDWLQRKPQQKSQVLAVIHQILERWENRLKSFAWSLMIKLLKSNRIWGYPCPWRPRWLPPVAFNLRWTHDCCW